MSLYSGLYALLHNAVRGLYRIKITGAENEPKTGPCIVCANHLSGSDVVIISASLTRQVRYMAKKELFKIPLLGQLIKVLGAYPIDRSGADISAIKKTIKLLNDGEMVGIFPQGTRYKGKEPTLENLKNGIAMIEYRAKATILPVYIKTKDNTVKFFKKTELIVGKPISFEELNFTECKTEEYKRVTEYIFGKIIELSEKDSDNGN